jgi:hypothetical protein
MVQKQGESLWEFI